MEASISLRQLLPNSRFVGGEDVQVSRLVSDPGDCFPGDLLVILPDCDDPTAVGCEGLARGAAGILTEQLLPVPLPQCIVADTDRAAAEVCDVLLDRPAAELLVIGVVGGDGKTSTSLLLSTLLRGEGVRTAYETDLGRCDGIVQSTTMGRPQSISAVCEFLAESRDAGATAVVLELSESMVRSAAFEYLQFDVLVLTGGQTSQHFGECQESFGQAVEDLALERLKEGGAAVVNADCPLAMAAADRMGVPTLTYGLRGEALVSAKVFEQQPGETTLLVTAGDVTAMMETSLTGPAMASSQLAAIAAGLLMETPLPKAIQHVTALRKIPGRMQRISQPNRPAVVLDLAGNASRLATVLRGLRRERNGGQLWVVAAGDRQLHPDQLACMGRTAERYADRTVLTIDPAHKGDFLGLAHQWLDGLNRVGDCRLVANREAAIRWVLEVADPRDTVLICGGWPTGSPGQQRAAIEADVSLIEALAAEPTAVAGESPVLLPFVAAK